jgi:hypothetical protein
LQYKTPPPPPPLSICKKILRLTLSIFQIQVLASMGDGTLLDKAVQAFINTYPDTGLSNMPDNQLIISFRVPPAKKCFLDKK